MPDEAPPPVTRNYNEVLRCFGILGLLLIYIAMRFCWYEAWLIVSSISVLVDSTKVNFFADSL